MKKEEKQKDLKPKLEEHNKSAHIVRNEKVDSNPSFSPVMPVKTRYHRPDGPGGSYNGF